MSATIRTLVVGVATLSDDDPVLAPDHGDPVLAPAAELARRLGATLHVVHAYELPPPVLTGYPDYLPALASTFPESYEGQILARLEAAMARFPGVDAVCHAVEGPAGRAICDVADREHAGLVVVGATRRGRVWRNLLGTTAERVVRASHVPVLVLHGPFTRPVRRVLLTTDLSPESGALHDRGLTTARAVFGEPLEAETLLVVGYDLMAPPPLREDLLKDAAEGELARFLDARPAPRPGGRVRVGDVPRQIVREAEEWGADLVVLGTHGRSGWQRFVLGSTAEATLRSAGCNVLVVPRATAAVAAGAPAREPDAGHAMLPALAM